MGISTLGVWLGLRGVHRLRCLSLGVPLDFQSLRLLLGRSSMGLLNVHMSFSNIESAFVPSRSMSLDIAARLPANYVRYVHEFALGALVFVV